MDKAGNVLVVDDDITFLKMVGDLLGATYAVSLAKSAEQAVRLLGSGYQPDIILLDISMPGTDGFAALEKLRESPAAQDVPVIFLTGLHSTDREIQGIQAGAVDYVRKPFKSEVLLARIERHLAQGRALKAMRQTGINEEKMARLSTQLTETEGKVARLIALGYSNQEIAAELNYSYFYVKKLAVIIFEKAGVSKRNELRRLLM